MERGIARRTGGTDLGTVTGPLPWLSIRLHPESDVPLSRQLAAQVGEALRDGRWRPGHRLPSGRALAGRLGVDRGTVLAAYRELAEQGLVRVRGGSGAYAADSMPAAAPDSGPDAGAGDAFRTFVARERARGAATRDLATLFERWRTSLAGGRVLVVEEEPGLAHLWGAELRGLLPGVEVASGTPADLRRRPERAAGAVVAASRRHVPGLRAALPPWVELVPLRAPGGSRERRLLLRLAVGAVVVLVSVSPGLRRRFRELAAGLRGREVAALALPPEPTPRLERALRVARFVLADVVSRPALEDRVEPRRLLCLPALDPAVGAELAERLALGRADPRGTSRRTPGRSGQARSERRRRRRA